MNKYLCAALAALLPAGGGFTGGLPAREDPQPAPDCSERVGHVFEERRLKLLYNGPRQERFAVSYRMRGAAFTHRLWPFVRTRGVGEDPCGALYIVDFPTEQRFVWIGERGVLESEGFSDSRIATSVVALEGGTFVVWWILDSSSGVEVSLVPVEVGDRGRLLVSQSIVRRNVDRDARRDMSAMQGVDRMRPGPDGSFEVLWPGEDVWEVVALRRGQSGQLERSGD